MNHPVFSLHIVVDQFTKNFSSSLRCRLDVAILNTALYKHFTCVSAHMGARIAALRKRISCRLFDTNRKSKNIIKFRRP
jgi:hypothetical protein